MCAYLPPSLPLRPLPRFSAVSSSASTTPTITILLVTPAFTISKGLDPKRRDTYHPRYQSITIPATECLDAFIMSPLHHLLKLSIRGVYVFSSVSLQKPPSQGLLSTTSPSQELGNCTRSADLVFCILRMHPFMPAAGRR